MTSILITEDHELFRDGLRRLVEEAVPGARIIEAGDYDAARAALAAHPDLALMLLDMQIPAPGAWTASRPSRPTIRRCRWWWSPRWIIRPACRACWPPAPTASSARRFPRRP